MEEASCTKAAYVSSYLDKTEDITVIQGPAARIRPKRLPEEFFTCKFILLCTEHMHVWPDAHKVYKKVALLYMYSVFLC